ncbi:MAG: glutaredoxin family protein [Candidatus Korobacteraceae bacterium]
MSSDPELPQVVLYTRKGCHLCDEVKDSLNRVSRQARFQLQEIDIDTDPELVRQFNDEIPVVFVRGRKAFKYHLKEEEFLRRLAEG